MREKLKQNISVLMAGKPLVTFREKFRGIFTTSSKKKVEGSVVISLSDESGTEVNLELTEK